MFQLTLCWLLGDLRGHHPSQHWQNLGPDVPIILYLNQNTIPGYTTTPPGLSVDWVGTLGSLPKTRRLSFGPSTPEASQRARKSRLEAEQTDAVPPNILDSPEEGKGFRSSWEINVKKLVGDAVGNVNLTCHAKRSGNSIITISLDEYKPCFARHCSCSVCWHFCGSYPLCSAIANIMVGEEDFSLLTSSHDSAFLAFSLKAVLGM